MREEGSLTDAGNNGQGEFEPEITAFTCIYCGYMAADTAGALRLKYPPNVKLVRMPCTGKVDVRYILQAFEQGADGVYIVACPIGNCHHIHGNERAVARVKYTKRLLDEVGVGGDRLEILFASGGMGATFAESAHAMVERVKQIGPNPLKLAPGAG
ncbi:MAG: hydrogenase iron-sulfur subunit [Anaerolineae bacterium]|nr:hydrogenase iron-sulfur subunit [Anaerolineae bacterium]